METNTLSTRIYYTETDPNKTIDFKKSAKYNKFRYEYIEAIDTMINFYLKYETDDNNKKSVKEGLNAFKHRLFDNKTEISDEHLTILFHGKKAMEEIAQALIPPKGELLFSPEAITEKLIAIYNLAGKDIDPLTGIEEIACMVCAPGTLRNLIDTAQLLNTGNLFDNVQIQRKNIILEVVRKYVLITHRAEIERQADWQAHDTNLLNVFINALSEEWGLPRVIDIYVDESTVTQENKVEINNELELAVTQDNITDRLASDYLRKIKENITINDDGTINISSANNVLDKFEKLYGKHDLTSVFSVDDKYQIRGITTDPTAIKVAISQFISQENNSREHAVNMYPLTWIEKTSVKLPDDTQGKNLYYSGDLFWIELTDNDGDTSIAIPSVQDLGKKSINKVGYSQLHQIIQQSSSQEDAKTLFQIKLERLETADKELLALFFSKLDTDNSLEMAIKYAHNHQEWFEYLVHKTKSNPLATILLTHKPSSELITDWPDIALKGMSAQQAEKFLSTRDLDATSAAKAMEYVTKHSEWFNSVVIKSRSNPLIPILLARLSHNELMALSPKNPLLYGWSKNQITEFLSCLDTETSVDNATKYVTQHPRWFTAEVHKYHDNPLFPILLTRLMPQELATWSPKGTVLKGLSAQQIEEFLFALAPKDSDVTKAIDYFTKHSKWFSYKMKAIGRNPLLPILLARLTQSELMALSPEESILQELSVQQIKKFLSALDPKRGAANAIQYVTEHSIWFNSLITKIGHNPLLSILLTRLTHNELADLSPMSSALSGLTMDQIEHFFSALDPENSGVANAVKFVTKYSKWFNQVTKIIKFNPLFPLILQRMDNNLLALVPDIALSGLSVQQVEVFFSKLIPDKTSVTGALKYVTQHKVWFESLVDKMGVNPLIPQLLTHLNQEEIATLTPNVALYNPSNQQTKGFLNSLDDPESKEMTKALAYANKHKIWFNIQVIRAKENLLIERMISLYSPQQLAEVTPDSIAFKGLNTTQAENFLYKLDGSKEGSITQALAYATKYEGWFSQLVKENSENPLTWLIKESLSGEQLSQLSPDSPALFGIKEDQARDFFTTLIDKNDGDITKAQAYASQHLNWFDNLIKEQGQNPLTYIITQKLTSPQLAELNPNTEISLRGLSATQASMFLHCLDPESRDITEALKYATLHNEWFSALVKRTKQNPLTTLLLNHFSPQELAIYAPDIAFEGMSVKQSRDFFNFLVHNSGASITPALEYANENRVWFNALLDDIGENPLTWLIMKHYSPLQLADLAPDNIALQGLSTSQFRGFFAKLIAHDTNLSGVIAYVSKHEQWFTRLIKKIGENPLLPLLKNLPRDALAKLKPDITLFGLSAEQSKKFFAQLVDGSNFTQALTYAETHEDWFIELVNRTGENPITSMFIKTLPGYLHRFSPGDFALWGMSARQAGVFLASMDFDDSLNRAIQYINKYQEWFSNLVEYTQENPLTALLIARLSSEQLAKQPPEIALLGLTEHQSQDFLSRMSPENAATYVKDHHQWFNQQGWDTAALLLPRKNTPISSDTAPFDIRMVNTWKIPAVEPLANEENTRFDGQVIIQLENDPIVREAAARLAGKHPKNSVIVQLDQNDDYHVVYGDLRKLEGITRWQLVGHSRVEGEYQTLGARSSAALAEQLGKFMELTGGSSPFPEHINLVGCALGQDDTTGSYLHQFAISLPEQNIRPRSISAYATKVAVNPQGQKRLTETGEKRVLTQDDEGWITTRIPGKVDAEGAGRELLATLNQAQNFEHAMDAVYHNNGLSEAEWLPMLHSLKKDPTQPKHYSLTFIRESKSKTGEPPEQRTVRINDTHIPDFIREYDQHLARSKNAFAFADGQLIPRSEDDIAEIEGVHGLNTAFILQTWFMQRARETATAGALPANLNTALQVHSYANYTQMGVGALDDGVKFLQVSRELFQEGSTAGSMFKAFSHFGTGAGVGLNALSVGLDSYELAHAQNEAQRAVFGTQLAFDLANLTVSVVSLGAGIAGAATLAGFLGPLGVPLAGLGIGITALVMTTQVHVEKIKAVGAYFANLDEGYKQGGYQCVNVKANDGTEHQIWRNHAGIAIKTLDLRLGHQMLTYADTYIYKTHINGIGSGYDNDITMALPQSEKRRLGKSAVVNIREGIDHRLAAVSFAPDEKIPLILPDTPQYYLDYNYETFPGVTSRHDAGFDVLRRIESNYRSHSDNFSFDFYCCPSEYAISELKAEYVATSVQVLLDDATRTIIMPTQSKETKDKMAYTLTGGNGTYHISLQEGASLKLEGGSAKTNWILDARSLSNNLAFNSSGQLCVGDIKITLAADFQGTLQLTNQEGLFVADVQKQQISLSNADVDASRFKDPRLLHAYLKQVTHTDLHNQPFVPVEDYLTPEGGRVGRAFYEAAKDRFIFTREPASAEFLRGAQLVKTDGDTAWFYRDISVWLVDIASGEILREYIPIDFEDGAAPSKSSVINDDAGNVYLIAEYQKTAGSIRYTWQLTEKTMTLIAISGDQQAIPNINDFFWSLPAQFSYDQRVIGALGDEIHLLARRDGHNYHSWLKKSAGETAHRPFLQANMATIAAEDIQPIPMQIGDKTRYYFYSRQQQTLYYQPDNGLSKTAVKAHAVKMGVHTLLEIQGQLIAQSSEGTLWLADAQGKLHLTGVTADWLRVHQDDVMTHLRKLVSTIDTLPVLRLQGLPDNRGRVVMAWYDIAADRVILAGAGIQVTHALHYRGLSADGKQAWVYDSDNKQLYRQPLETQTPFTLNKKGQSTTKVPPATRWSSWQYRSAVSAGNHLRLVTDDGAVLLLPKMASTQTYPQLIAWQTKKQTQAQSAAAIEALRGQVILVPAIRQLTEQTGQTPTWYLTEQKTFLQAHGLNSEHDLHWLGQSAGLPSAHYIHDRTTGDLWLANSSHSTAIGRYRFIFQLQDELVLQYDPSNHVKTLILPQLMGMDRIALTGKTAGAHYQLNAATLKYYQQIVIDEQGQKPVIHLPETLTRLVVQSSSQDLILLDHASKTRICIANAEQAAERGMKIEIEGISSFSINHLVKKMDQLGAQLPGDKQLKGSLTGIILQISPTDHTVEYSPLSTNAEQSSELKTSVVHLTGTMSTFDATRYNHSGLLIDNSAQLNQLPKSMYYHSKHL